MVQEATVPGTKKVFLCGDRSISWLDMIISVTAFRSCYMGKKVPMPEDLKSLGPFDVMDPVTRLGLIIHSYEDP